MEPAAAAAAATSCPQVSGAALALFSQLLGTLTARMCSLADPASLPPDAAPSLRAAYDAVVVGGGTAGAVVAARLAAAGWSVALLEAGGAPPASSVVPGLLFSLQGSDMDWGYRAEAAEGLHGGLQEGRVRWPRGKVLGGSSAMNAMLYLRGTARDFDDWAVLGNPGWAHEDLLPLFRRAEQTQPVGPFNSDEPVKRLVVEAARELGYPELDELDGREGWGEAPGTLRDGERWSAARAFLGAARNLSHLHVARYCRATRILLDEGASRATGVQFLRDGRLETVLARREVVVSAGAVGSPQLLMLSGLGPRSHLQEVGVPPLADLPVGDHLQDHVVFTGVLVELPPGAASPRADLLDASYEYLARRRGPLAHIGATDLQGFASSSLSPGRPDLQFHHVLFRHGDELLARGFLHATGFVPQVAEQLLQATRRADVLLVVPTLLRPSSRGEVRLSSADPLAAPRISPRYLDHPRDEDVLLEGVRLVLRLAGTRAFARVGARARGYELPACPPADSLSDDYWRCALRQLATTLYHPAGSCRMGPSADGDSVVDPRLRVHGVRGLRVADASVMPAVVSANTAATCLVIGEKAAALILDDWARPRDEM
ncbi:glucose dehydrogenase [FAD, quinone]-like [Bacillus rossius redtenbacheri]|uniref:glucose dehydrogenase [FAD, quinone]-like n=1 Tax=Bacillus rossius redtenbacheri TaxID=93214 RepID=UPI002FDCE659